MVTFLKDMQVTEIPTSRPNYPVITTRICLPELCILYKGREELLPFPLPQEAHPEEWSPPGVPDASRFPRAKRLALAFSCLPFLVHLPPTSVCDTHTPPCLRLCRHHHHSCLQSCCYILVSYIDVFSSHSLPPLRTGTG